MKIAVLSDIHGNYIALKKCIIDAKEHNVDRYVFLGDYLGEFPYPHRTLDILDRKSTRLNSSHRL